MLRVIPLKKYCAITGESVGAIERRIDRGYWVLGVHYHKRKEVKERAIDLDAIEKWWREGSKEFL